MGLTLSLRTYESLRMSEITIATRSRDSAQPIRMQVSFELGTFLSFPIFLNLEWIPLLHPKTTIFSFLCQWGHLWPLCSEVLDLLWKTCVSVSDFWVTLGVGGCPKWQLMWLTVCVIASQCSLADRGLTCWRSRHFHLQFHCVFIILIRSDSCCLH